MRFRAAGALTLCLAALCLTAACVTGESGTAGGPLPVTLEAGPEVGGLSGIEVSDNGAHFTAISDRGLLVQGDLLRQGGRLTGARVTSFAPLRLPEGRAMPAEGLDTEGLARMPDGGLAVSLELHPEVWIYPPDGGAPRALPPPPDAPVLGINGMYEALAVDPEGRLVTLPEVPLGGGSHHSLWRLEAGQWREVAILASDDGFRPVGADFASDGTLYLLERAFGRGFRNRLVRLDPEAPDLAPVTVWATSASRATNYEGVSIWTDAQGRDRAVLVSDDNFMRLLNQSLLEIPLDPGGTSR